MSGSAAVRAAIFAAGALVGGGVAAFVSRRPQHAHSRPLPSVSTSESSGQIVGFDGEGKATLVDSGMAPSSLFSPSLKYGHPGQY
jgi:endonuclease G